MLGLPMMLLVELALQHCICTFASYRECAASAKHRAHVRPQCPAHARMVLRGGGDEGVRDILQALPDSVRGWACICDSCTPSVDETVAAATTATAVVVAVACQLTYIS